MMDNTKKMSIATWIVCLGIANKKDTVTETLNREGIKVCCIQETEIEQGFPEEVLNCNGFVMELEMNDAKKRAGIYVHKNINYKRRRDLEKNNMHVVIIDIIGLEFLRVICVSRSFRPIDMTPGVFFDSQLEIIKNSVCKNCYILGDFNLDARMESWPDYDKKLPLAQLFEFAVEYNFNQIVDFCTWSRVINGAKKESLIDHVYHVKPYLSFLEIIQPK